MSASSGLEGICNVCGHMYNEHNRYKCNGQDQKKGKNGKKEWSRCQRYWYICQQSHDTNRRNAYQLCHNCISHPGGGPSGSEPGGSLAVATNFQPFTAQWNWDAPTSRFYFRGEQGNYPYDGPEATGDPSFTTQQEEGTSEDALISSTQSPVLPAGSDNKGKANAVPESVSTTLDVSISKASYTRHIRHDSGNSEDPLAWDPEKIKEAEREMGDLASAFSRVQVEDVAASSAPEGQQQETPIYVEMYEHKKHLCFKNPEGKEVKTDRGDWQEFTKEDGLQNFYWTSPKSGRHFWTWELPAVKKQHRRGKTGKP